MDHEKKKLVVVGMTGDRGDSVVDRTLNKKVAGVVAASVNFGKETATVEYIGFEGCIRP